MTAPIVTHLSRRPFNAAQYLRWLELFDEGPNFWIANGHTPSSVRGQLWHRVAEGKRRDG